MWGFDDMTISTPLDYALEERDMLAFSPLCPWKPSASPAVTQADQYIPNDWVSEWVNEWMKGPQAFFFLDVSPDVTL